MRGFVIFLMVLSWVGVRSASADDTPSKVVPLLNALKQTTWDKLEEGLHVLRVITPDGLVLTSYKISPDRFQFSVVTQSQKSGSRAKDIGESEGAVIATNGGFFAVNGGGKLYSVGYLRLDGKVRSKGWANAGGTITFRPEGLALSPSHAGIPQNQYDVLQSRPMLIEPGGKWAMGSNSGAVKLRTLLCTQKNGDVLLTTVTRLGLTLFESGWILRSQEQGGFFGCDAALALDGGRSTQVWHSGEPRFSYSGFTPVHNFLVVRQREAQ